MQQAGQGVGQGRGQGKAGQGRAAGAGAGGRGGGPPLRPAWTAGRRNPELRARLEDLSERLPGVVLDGRLDFDPPLPAPSNVDLLQKLWPGQGWRGCGR